MNEQTPIACSLAATALPDIQKRVRREAECCPVFTFALQQQGWSLGAANRFRVARKHVLF